MNKAVFANFNIEVAELIQKLDGQDITDKIGMLRSNWELLILHNPSIKKDLELNKIRKAGDNIFEYLEREKDNSKIRELLGGLLKITGN